MHKVSQSTTNQECKLSIDQSKNILKTKDEPRKILVRNCDVRNLQNIVEYKRDVNSQKDTTKSEEVSEEINLKDNDKSIFSEPRLLTSLKIVENIQSIAEKAKRTIRVKECQQQNTRISKINKKVNIPFDEKIYKDLIDLHVNDEDLGINAQFNLKPKEFIKIKEPEPVLSDFYKPAFDKEYVVRSNIPKFEIDKICFEQNSAILKSSRRWEPEDINYF